MSSLALKPTIVRSLRVCHPKMKVVKANRINPKGCSPD